MRKVMFVMMAGVWAIVVGCGVSPQAPEVKIVSPVPGPDGMIHVNQGEQFSLRAETAGPAHQYDFDWNVGNETSTRRGGQDYVGTLVSPGIFNAQVTVTDIVTGMEDYDSVNIFVHPVPTPVVIVPPGEVVFVFDKVIIEGGTKVGNNVECELGKLLILDLINALSGPDGPYDCDWYVNDQWAGSGHRFEWLFDRAGKFSLRVEIWKHGVLRKKIFFYVICVGGVTPTPRPVILEFRFISSEDKLAWGSENAFPESEDPTPCMATGAWSGEKAANGSELISQNGSYTLTCFGPGGTSDSKTVIVTEFEPPVCEKPALTFTASASSITAGQSVTLNWNAGNATSISVSATPAVTGWSGSPSGTSWTSGALSEGPYTFTFTATNACGSTTLSRTVVVSGVVSNPVVVITAPGNDTTFEIGKAVTFTAQVTGGTPPYVYNWLFTDSVDATPSTTQASISKIFHRATAGEFPVDQYVEVMDSQGRKSFMATVRVRIVD